MKITKQRFSLQRNLHLLKNNRKKGTTLVELLVSLVLISILMAMVAAALSSATRIFVKVQKTQYAQSILDTVMTELRGMTEEASGYIKIYPAGQFKADAEGVKTGTTLEFQTSDGYVEVLSHEGIEETTIYIGENQSGTFEAVDSGRLLTRYYNLNESTGTYVVEKGDIPVARAVAKAFGEGFYMKNYLEIEYTATPNADGKVSNIQATLKLYPTNADGTKQSDPIATDTTNLELRNPLPLKTTVTATSGE